MVGPLIHPLVIGSEDCTLRYHPWDLRRGFSFKFERYHSRSNHCAPLTTSLYKATMSFNLKKSSPPLLLPSTLEATVGGRTVLVRVSMEDKQVSSQIGVRGVVPHRPCARLSFDRPGCLIDVARGDSSSSEFNRALFSFPSKSSHPALPKHAQGICAQAWYLAAIEALAQGVRRVDRGVGASHRSVVREGRRRRCRWAGIVADHRGWEERRPQPHYPVNPVDP